MEWGGVKNKNDNRIISLGEDICKYLVKVEERISLDISSREYYFNEMIMNSGFTKIYSLYIDNFVIYDGRVGAALGLFVRKFCEDYNYEEVPSELMFSWGKGKETTYTKSSLNKRNPSTDKYLFTELTANPKRHTENNIRANWLLKEIINKTDSKFSKLKKTEQLRALEASLFMIGYDVKC